MSGCFYMYLREENTGFAGQLDVGVRERRTSRTLHRTRREDQRLPSASVGLVSRIRFRTCALEMCAGDQWVKYASCGGWRQDRSTAAVGSASLRPACARVPGVLRVSGLQEPHGGVRFVMWPRSVCVAVCGWPGVPGRPRLWPATGSLWVRCGAPRRPPWRARCLAAWPLVRTAACVSRARLSSSAERPCVPRCVPVCI